MLALAACDLADVASKMEATELHEGDLVILESPLAHLGMEVARIDAVLYDLSQYGFNRMAGLLRRDERDAA
jgi:hypothetical protein